MVFNLFRMLIEIVLSSFLSIVSALADPWKTLGISRSASTKEIKTGCEIFNFIFIPYFSVQKIGKRMAS